MPFKNSMISSPKLQFALTLFGVLLLSSSGVYDMSMIQRSTESAGKLLRAISYSQETILPGECRERDAFNMMENASLCGENSKMIGSEEIYKSQTSFLPPSSFDTSDTFSLSAKAKQDRLIIESVTTRVGATGFDPLVQERNVHKFVPILEARGGTDKDKAGHRKDSLPLASAIVNVPTQSVNSAIFQFLEEDNGTNVENIRSNDALARVLRRLAHGLIVRINPGTLSATTHHKIDNILRELAKEGIVVMNHPDVSSTLGAKDVSTSLKKVFLSIVKCEHSIKRICICCFSLSLVTA